MALPDRTHESLPDSIVDPMSGRLRFDSQSREYRRFRRREWREWQVRLGGKRIDLWLSPAAYNRLLAAIKPNEPYAACIERALELLPSRRTSTGIK